MKKILSLSGFCILLLNLFLLHGGIVLLAGLMEHHRRWMAEQLHDMKLSMGAVSGEDDTVC